jgi:hypothetical protein
MIPRPKEVINTIGKITCVAFHYEETTGRRAYVTRFREWSFPEARQSDVYNDLA